MEFRGQIQGFIWGRGAETLREKLFKKKKKNCGSRAKYKIEYLF
jgi:hypothetical protein